MVLLRAVLNILVRNASPRGPMLCFVPVLHGCVCCYVGNKAFLQCLQLLRGGIWACMRYPCLCLYWMLG